MLNIHCLTLGDYQTNCYILHAAGSSGCCVIDPGYEPERIVRYLEEKGLQLEAVLLTHGHFDHVGGVKNLAAETDCRVYLCPEEERLPSMLTAGRLYYTDSYTEGDILELAGLTIRVIQTPGHTPGSVCLLVEDAMFSGDTLFAGSCGRTDLPGGNMQQMAQSLTRLSKLEGQLQVFPGHGPQTTLTWEKQTNPYL